MLKEVYYGAMKSFTQFLIFVQINFYVWNRWYLQTTFVFGTLLKISSVAFVKQKKGRNQKLASLKRLRAQRTASQLCNHLRGSKMLYSFLNTKFVKLKNGKRKKHNTLVCLA